MPKLAGVPSVSASVDGTAPEMWLSTLVASVAKLRTVVVLYVSPGRRTVGGNSGRLGESGKCWVSSATELPLAE